MSKKTSDESTTAVLWQPPSSAFNESNMAKFMTLASKETGKEFKDYDALYNWSVTELAGFWGLVWKFFGIKSSENYTSVLKKADKVWQSKWFPGAKLNFAENLLRFRDDNIAILFRSEDGPTRKLTYQELYDEVSRLAQALRELGVQTGDRVAGYIPNMPETIVAMLAATSIGAVWSSCSPDFGIQGVKDRFGQIKPKVLFCADSYQFKGKRLIYSDKVDEVASLLPELEHIIFIPFQGSEFDAPKSKLTKNYQELITKYPAAEIEFEQLPFDHPVYIMYSSGTTGLPKCMVQGPGVLLNHIKEHSLHNDLKAGERVFYYTTCGWMMWNWLVSALALHSTICLFDGNPFHPDWGVLFKYAEEEEFDLFGTSARFITALADEKARPGENYDLSRVRTLMSTGSPLGVDGFDYSAEHIGDHIQIASISGGTDLNGCFALGNPMRPVFRGELQCRGLGMAVDIFDDSGKSLVGEKGELVCTEPFPSMPLYFWGDDEKDSKYYRAYFDHFENIWRHGDFAERTLRDGFIVYGRSDATLNPGGVRIGTAELYNVIETVTEIDDSVVIGQTFGDDTRIILFVKMAPAAELNDDLKTKLRTLIKNKVSPRHMPAKIIAVPDVPYTINMKKVELAVRNVVEGRAVTNRDALKNPECLDYFKDIPELQTE